MLLPSPEPVRREAIDWFKGNLTPLDPALSEIQRRLVDYWSSRLPIEVVRGEWPADAVGYIIGVDPASPEGDVSVRFLSREELTHD